ncbi:M48 family metallopeptidase [Methylobacterium sp. J-092]|uniref:M48 family metallopeptidase n=1 Tax=Methylobacterium sp. J-092 TaxID=2836667 RepID=UPI00391AEE58
MMALTASGRWFDGRSAAPHAVTLHLGERLEITGLEVHRDWNLTDLRAGEGQAPLLRLGIAGDPGHVEVVDPSFAACLETRCPDLRKRADAGGGTWRLVAGSLAVGIAVLLTVFFGLPIAAGVLAPLVPAGIEARLGTAVEAQVLDLMGEPAPCAEPAGRAVLDRLVARLAAGRGLPPDLAVTVRRHDTANAVTLPGARVVVLSELIAKARSADEFAGVLAHELGHVALRDPTRALIQASGTSFLLSLVLGDLTGSTVIVALGQAVLSAGYSRDAERAADAYSVAAMRSAGGDAAALASMLERIAKDEADADPALLRSHPFTRERAATIRALAGARDPDRHILSDADWMQLRGICPGATDGPDKPAPKPRPSQRRRV